MRLARLLGTTTALFCLLAAGAVAHAAPRPNLAALQSALEQTGHYEGQVDGMIGPMTRRAIVRFQRSAGLAPTGAVGAETRRALGWRGRPPTGSRAMAQGHRGWDVAALQFLLQHAGHGPGRIDAVFGPMTREAVGRAWMALDRSPRGHAPRGLLRALANGDAQHLVSHGTAGSSRFSRPVPGPIGDRFGAPRGGSRVHQGVDFPLPSGTPVVASAPGTVIFAGWNSGGYGNLVVIQHSEGYTTWYAHLSSIAVRNGQRVGRGAGIGRVGSTGFSTGPHLHFEIRRYDTPINPAPLLVTGSSLHAAALHSNGGDRDAHGDHCHGGGADRQKAPAGGNWIATEPLCPAE